MNIDLQENFFADKATQDTTQDATQVKNIVLTDNDKKLLPFVSKNPYITHKELAETLDWKIDRIKYYLRKLKNKDVVKRIGTSQNGFWQINEKHKNL